MTNAAIDPFVVEISDADLDELTQRLRRTRWAADPGNEDQIYGLSTKYLKGLVDYWIDGFDWRAAERRHQRVHSPPGGRRRRTSALHPRARQRPNAHPAHPLPRLALDLLVYSKVIRPLADPASYGGDPADAFDVIVPSLPASGSPPPPPRDMNHWKMADLWNTLMTESSATEIRRRRLGLRFTGHRPTRPQVRQNLYGIHLGHGPAVRTCSTNDTYWSLGRSPTATPEDMRREVISFFETYASHVACTCSTRKPSPTA